jgi:NAD-dependent dihydropyrimidine dehydrogenase PreA subunit
MADTEDGYRKYLGIPRTLIPWYPSIDTASCTACGVCASACKHGVYAYEQNPGKVAVTNPYHCEVYCESCRFQCPVGAISFPDRKAVKLVIKGLRKDYPPTA